MVLVNCITVAIVVGDVLLPLIHSTNFIISAGAKKCIPITLSGDGTTEAIYHNKSFLYGC